MKLLRSSRSFSQRSRTSQHRHYRWSGLAAILFIAGVVASGPMIDYLSAETPSATASPDKSYANSLSEAFRQASEKALDSVVTIRTQPKAVSRAEVPWPDRDRRGRSPLEEFFGSPFGFSPGTPMPPMQPQPRAGSGSGVIIDAGGVILTNNHVVAGGGKVIVALRDGREFEATEVKTDPRTDLAVVWIDASEKLPAATLGDSDSLRIGDWVLALGQPFGLKDSVTAGIISAKDRGVGLVGREEFLQTDAAINPGNSGGPLIDLDGKVVGINTAISSSTGGYQGVGFAIPVNLARWVSGQLVEHGAVRRAFLGVTIQSVTPELAGQFGGDVKSGAAITRVLPDTPSAEAGLQAGDVVVDFAGTRIEDARDLQAVVERTEVGATKPVRIVRDGKSMTVQVKLREQPSDGSLASLSGEPSATSDALEQLGLEVDDLSENVARQLGLKDTSGVVITSVTAGSAADLAGLAPSMVITQVNRQPVRTVEDLHKALEAREVDQGVLLLVRDQNGSRFVVIHAEK
ncbi:MAG: Do family serine endopeptidase [Actinobacteria bacterium]|nr:Do family serine endopeptidase [Actinomycetota bacterium]